MGSPRRTTVAVRLACAALLLSSATSCAEPAKGSADYAEKAAASAHSAASDVATAKLAASIGGHDRAWRPYLDIVLTSAEDGLSSVVDTFDSVQPPTPGDDRLRQTVDGVLQQALAVVAALRIEVRRHGGAGLPAIAAKLDPVAKALDQLSGQSS